MVRVTLEGSFSGCTKRQRATLRGLGLKRRGRSVILRNTPPILGMIRKVEHLVRVEV
ncbi:MAG: 50S ribosomal protein L30 [Deltaproteobacteria bacterium]